MISRCAAHWCGKNEALWCRTLVCLNLRDTSYPIQVILLTEITILCTLSAAVSLCCSPLSNPLSLHIRDAFCCSQQFTTRAIVNSLLQPDQTVCVCVLYLD